MTNGLDQGPRWGTVGPAPKDGPPEPRPIWAIPALILGLLIAAWTVGLLVDFVASTWADPSGRIVHSMVLGYLLPFTVPLSAILLVAGGLGIARPLPAKRRRTLRRVWIVGVLIFAISAFTVPWLITTPP